MPSWIWDSKHALLDSETSLLSQLHSFFMGSFLLSGIPWCSSRMEWLPPWKLSINPEELVLLSGRRPLLALWCRVPLRSWIQAHRQWCCWEWWGVHWSDASWLWGRSLLIPGANHITSGHAHLLWCPILQPFQVFPLHRMSIYTSMDQPFDISSHVAPAQKTNQEWHFVTIFSAIAHNLV